MVNIENLNYKIKSNPGDLFDDNSPVTDDAIVKFYLCSWGDNSGKMSNSRKVYYYTHNQYLHHFVVQVRINTTGSLPTYSLSNLFSSWSKVTISNFTAYLELFEDGESKMSKVYRTYNTVYPIVSTEKRDNLMCKDC